MDGRDSLRKVCPYFYNLFRLFLLFDLLYIILKVKKIYRFVLKREKIFHHISENSRRLQPEEGVTLNIAIVDDCAEDGRHLSQLLGTYCSVCSLTLQISAFTRAADFLRSWRSGVFDLIFIDIFLDKDSDTAAGIRLAEHIRREDSSCTIIFTTVSPDFALKSYSLKALDYLVKPISTEDFSRTMDYYLSMKAKRFSHYIEVKESRVMVKLPIDTILYTDYFNHYIQIHLADRIVKTYMRFEDFSKLLLCYPQFISCYRNCIINLDKVVRLEKTSFVLTSGEHLPITRSLRLQIHQQYADYQFRKINGGIE